MKAKMTYAAHRASRRYPQQIPCGLREGDAKAAIYRLISEGHFPKQVQLSERTSACLGGKWGRNLYGRSDR
jgi:hypothetical protein